MSIAQWPTLNRRISMTYEHVGFFTVSKKVLIFASRKKIQHALKAYNNFEMFAIPNTTKKDPKSKIQKKLAHSEL